MASKIVLPAVVIVMALSFVSAERIKCYECIAIGAADDSCDGEIMVKSDQHKPIECTTSSLNAWHARVGTYNQLRDIVDVFRVDADGHKVIDVPMACLKMNLRINNQPAILRTCQTAKTEQVDTCKSITKKIVDKYYEHTEVVNCTVCDTDSCNGSYGLSPTMQIAFLPLLGSLLMGIFYSSA